MARASIPTHLSLDRFARILGLNPIHFAGGVGSTIFPIVGSCTKVWPQHTWQNENDILSREEVAQAIYDAEQDIKSTLGFAVAPTWETQELRSWPVPVRGWHNPFPQTVKTLWGKVISPGVRAVTAVDEAATVTYSDPDGDGFDELATLTAATALTDASEIKVYFAGMDAEPEWEIRPVRSKSISGGTVTITADSWLFLDPDLWERYPPAGGVPAINIEDAANYVTTADIYREYTDTTAAASVFFWHGSGGSSWCYACGGTGCAVCGLTTQEGCLAIVNGQQGLVRPYPALYDEDTSAWGWTTPSRCEWPDQVRLNYYAGMYSQRFLRGQDTDPLEHYLAQAITWLAVARLQRPICDCGNANTVAKEYQRDITQVTKGNDRFMRFENMSAYTNPFGTRYGEVKAWERVSALMPEMVVQGIAL